MTSSADALPDALGELLPPALAAASASVGLRKGTLLFRQRQRPRDMYYVVSGEIVLERVGERGDAVVLQRVRQGFVAEASLQARRYHCDALVMSAGRAVVLPIDGIKAELARDPAFALRWIGTLNTEVRRLRAQCERLSLKGVGERLLHLIETEGRGGMLDIPSGLKALAPELAVTHEALYRAVAVMERDRVLVRGAGHVRLLPGSEHRSR